SGDVRYPGDEGRERGDPDHPDRFRNGLCSRKGNRGESGALRRELDWGLEPGAEVIPKVFQLFKEVAPTLVRVVYLYDPATKSPVMEKLMQSYAQTFKLEIQLAALPDPTGVEQAFAAFKPGTNGPVIDGSTPTVIAAQQICGLALKRGLLTAAGSAPIFPRVG